VTLTPASTPSSTGASPSPTHDTLEPGNVYVDVGNSQGEGDFVGALTDADTSSCARDGVAWFDSGTLENPSGEDADYRTWVVFIELGGQTVGLVSDNIDGVAPGETGDYSVLPYTGAGTLACVLRVERRVAADLDEDQGQRTQG
jgi:hypothetical protein